MSIEGKILIQCDFDGTVTEEDVSFALLDTHAKGDWRWLVDDYRHGKISLGTFNSTAFSMVKDSKKTLLKTASLRAKARAGFTEFVGYCRARGFRFVIVSNGLDFYIHDILSKMGLGDVEIFASETRFGSDGIKVKYVGPDGAPLDDGFKEAYVRSFLKDGYHVIYIGDGFSDIPAAKRCHHIFATRELATRCREMNLDCTPFVDFHEVRRGLEALSGIKAQ